MIKESYLMVDAIAQKDNVFTRTDARVKVLLCIIALAGVLGWPGFELPLGVLALTLISMLVIKTPVKLMFGRIIPPLALGLAVFCLMLFSRGTHPLFIVQTAIFKLVAYREGFFLGATVLARIAGSVSILLFLSVTTPVHELGQALISFRVPRVLVEILLLTYRYIFVLWDEGIRIREAQTLRLGYPTWNSIAGWKRALKSTSTLMGMIFIRAYDRAERTFAAMQVRAYNGNSGGTK